MTSVASSSSNCPIIVKIVVDTDEFNRLKKRETFANTAFLKQKSALKYPDPVVPKQTGTGSKVQTGTGTKDQEGSGWTLGLTGLKDILSSLFADFQSKTLALISNLLEAKLNDHLKKFGKQLTSIKENQSGRGSDLVETPALTLPPKPSLLPLITGQIIQQKSQQQPDVDRHKLLKLVPKNFRNRAGLLLDFLYDNPTDVTWDKHGVVTIQGLSIPQSNIFTLFRALYGKKDAVNDSMHGLYTLTTFLISAGLGRLFNAGKTKGVLRRRKKTYEFSKYKKYSWKKLASDQFWYKLRAA